MDPKKRRQSEIEAKLNDLRNSKLNQILQEEKSYKPEVVREVIQIEKDKSETLNKCKNIFSSLKENIKELGKIMYSSEFNFVAYFQFFIFFQSRNL